MRRLRHGAGWIARVLWLVLLWAACGPAAADGIEIITSPDRAGRTVDRPLTRALFTMRIREWPDGTPARVFVLPDTDPVHDRFAREQLGTYPYVLRAAWDRMVFTGTGLAPTVVQSEAEMRQRVRATPGAIGYVLSRGPTTDSLRPTAGVALLESAP